jgi:HEAT repeat protein
MSWAPAVVHKRWLALFALLGFCVMVGMLVSWLNSRSPVYQGKTVRTWLWQLSATDPKACREAEAAFRALGTNAVPELAKLLRADDPLWRQWSRRYAFRLPLPLREVVLPWVSPPQAYLVRPAAARALGKLGPGAAPAIPDLARALRDRRNEPPWEVAGALGRIGQQAVPELTGALRDEDELVRRAAAGALGGIGADAAPAVPTLIQMLTQGSPDEQQAVAQSLAGIGTPAVAPLINILVHERGAASEAAAGALLGYYGRLDPPLPTAKNLSADDDDAARQQAFEMLGASDLADGLVTRLLIGALRDPAPGVRLTTLRTLVQGNRNLRPALASLVAALKDESPAIREWSARALGKIGPPAKASIPGLSRLAQDKEEAVRTAALAALEAINPSGSTNATASRR